MNAIPHAGRALRGAVLVGFLVPAGSAIAAPPMQYLGNQNGPGGAFDVLSDGRLIGMSGNAVLIETAPQSSQFSEAGFFDPGLISEFGASFLTVSPDGTRFVVGDGNFGGAHVFEVAINDLNGGSISHRSFVHENFAAAWYDHNRLAITAADPNTFLGEVSVLDLSNGQSTRVLELDGASGGLAFDHQGNLFTGNGFDVLPGGSETGDIRAFLAADIAEVLNGQRGVLEFASAGQFIGQLLSASGMAFDANGNLFIGGGDFNRGEFDYFAIADELAVQRAIDGLGSLDGSDLFTADPDGEPFSFYGAMFNDITGEWLVASGSSVTLYRYAEIPAPGTCLVLTLGIGFVGTRRARERSRHETK
jgi:hypothetical protein